MKYIIVFFYFLCSGSFNLARSQDIPEGSITERRINEYCYSLLLFKIDVGRFPNSTEGLKSLMEKPVSISTEMWRGPYIKKPLKDEWGTSFIYHIPGKHDEEYDLTSKGADGILSTEDDWHNWNPDFNNDKKIWVILPLCLFIFILFCSNYFRKSVDKKFISFSYSIILCSTIFFIYCGIYFYLSRKKAINYWGDRIIRPHKLFVLAENFDNEELLYRIYKPLLYYDKKLFDYSHLYESLKDAKIGVQNLDVIKDFKKSIGSGDKRVLLYGNKIPPLEGRFSIENYYMNRKIIELKTKRLNFRSPSGYGPCCWPKHYDVLISKYSRATFTYVIQYNRLLFKKYPEIKKDLEKLINKYPASNPNVNSVIRH